MRSQEPTDRTSMSARTAATQVVTVHECARSRRDRSTISAQNTPASDAPQSAGGAVTLSYYDNDLPRTTAAGPSPPPPTKPAPPTSQSSILWGRGDDRGRPRRQRRRGDRWLEQ